jgi:hypothetical protein
MMRQVREVLRLRTAGVGLNEIARRVGVAPSTVRLTLKRLATAGLSWPLPAEMTDSALETALFAAAGTKQGHRRHVEPDWAEVHRELKRKHVTLTMLWDEYIERCPEGYRYSRFCELYRGWASAAVGHDAANSHRRRQAVCRLHLVTYRHRIPFRTATSGYGGWNKYRFNGYSHYEVYQREAFRQVMEATIV